MLRTITIAILSATSLLGTAALAADPPFTPTCDMYSTPILQLKTLALPKKIPQNLKLYEKIVHTCAEQFGINFADHYTVCSPGDTGGQINFIIDRLNGKVLRLPDTQAGIDIKPGCNLITLEYNPNMLMVPESVQTHYLVWDGKHSTLHVPQGNNN